LEGGGPTRTQEFHPPSTIFFFPGGLSFLTSLDGPTKGSFFLCPSTEGGVSPHRSHTPNQYNQQGRKGGPKYSPRFFFFFFSTTSGGLVRFFPFFFSLSVLGFLWGECQRQNPFFFLFPPQTGSGSVFEKVPPGFDFFLFSFFTGQIIYFQFFFRPGVQPSRGGGRALLGFPVLWGATNTLHPPDGRLFLIKGALRFGSFVIFLPRHHF